MTIKQPVLETLESLDAVFQSGQRILIVTHNNPDPDALASAFAIKLLLEKRYEVQTSVALAGVISRAENRAMVKELQLSSKEFNRIKLDSYDGFIMVDTQPSHANHALPPDLKFDLVLDHHPHARGFKSKVELIDPDVGSSATLVIQLLKAAKVTFTPNVATALAYAIRSETQDLGREAGKIDVDAYFVVYPRASMKKMSRISNPKLPNVYFQTLQQSLNRVESYRQLVCLHLGEVPNPEIVAEMADFYLRHERISWVLCTGRYDSGLTISVRTQDHRANAGRLVKELVPNPHRAGGHGMFAGGRIDMEENTDNEISKYEKRLAKKFAARFGYKEVEWRSLLPNR